VLAALRNCKLRGPKMTSGGRLRRPAVAGYGRFVPAWSGDMDEVAASRRARRLAVPAVAAALLALPSTALAATIQVTNRADEVGAGNGCSLREALTAANRNTHGPGGDCAAGSATGTDKIVVPGGAHYRLTRKGVREEKNATGDLDALSDVRIVGTGASKSVIDAQGLDDRVLDVRSGNVSLRDLAVTNGHAPTGPRGADTGDASPGNPSVGGEGTTGDDGGGIRNAATLTLTRVLVSGNVAGTGGKGGAAGKGGAGLTGGAAEETGRASEGGFGGGGGSGGGIANIRTLKLVDSDVVDNAAGAGGAGGPAGTGGGATGSSMASGGASTGGGGGPGGYGGGIFQLQVATKTTIARSRVLQNRAGGGGGGAAAGTGGQGSPGGGLGAFGGIGGASTGGDGGDAGGGGGIFAGDGTISIVGTSVRGNQGGVGGNGGPSGTGGNAGPTSGGDTGPGGPANGGPGGDGGLGGGYFGSNVEQTLTSDTFGGNVAGAGASGGTGGTGGLGGPGGTARSTGYGGAGGAGGNAGGVLLATVQFTGGGDARALTIVANRSGRGGNGGAPGTATGNVAGAGGKGGSAAGLLSNNNQFGLDNATVARNVVAGGGSGAPNGASGQYGGLMVSSKFINLATSIVAYNTTPQCGPGVSDLGFNDEYPHDGSCTSANLGDPLLGLLADNGGPVPTAAPAAASPAIDAFEPLGGLAVCSSPDARGVTRPKNGRCDIGAVERSLPRAVTGAATAITATSAHLGGTANPGQLRASRRFRFGKKQPYARQTPFASVGSGGAGVAVGATVRGLKPNTTYHYRLVVKNPDGTATGIDKTFKTRPG
jgi:CSLREA domain-containing protein